MHHFSSTNKTQQKLTNCHCPNRQFHKQRWNCPPHYVIYCLGKYVQLSNVLMRHTPIAVDRANHKLSCSFFPPPNVHHQQSNPFLTHTHTITKCNWLYMLGCCGCITTIDNLQSSALSVLRDAHRTSAALINAPLAWTEYGINCGHPFVVNMPTFSIVPSVGEKESLHHHDYYSFAGLILVRRFAYIYAKRARVTNAIYDVQQRQKTWR